MTKIIYFLQIFILFSAPVFAKRKPASWTLTSRYETKPQSDIKRSVVEFRKGESISLYRPDEAPYGLVMKEHTVIGEKLYFVTGWANGAKSLLYRIFAPESFGIQPLCEVVSFSESTKLKVEKSTLKIEVLESLNDTEKWVDCRDISTHSSSN